MRDNLIHDSNHEKEETCENLMIIMMMALILYDDNSVDGAAMV